MEGGILPPMGEKANKTIYADEGVLEWVEGLAEVHDRGFSEQMSIVLQFARTEWRESAPKDEIEAVERARKEHRIERLESELEGLRSELE